MRIQLTRDYEGLGKTGNEVEVLIVECDHADEYQPHKFLLPNDEEVWLPSQYYEELE